MIARKARLGKLGRPLTPKGLKAIDLRASIKATLDRMCREVIFARDGYKCARCGKETNLQWCHVRSRRYLTTRWLQENCLTLCAGCHLFWHHEPLTAAEWFNRTFPRRAEMLECARTWKKVDMAAVQVYLQQEMQRVGVFAK